MRITATLSTILAAATYVAVALLPAPRPPMSCPRTLVRMSAASSQIDAEHQWARRGVLQIGVATLSGLSERVDALGKKRVVVAGATGQTGRRIVQLLSSASGVEVIGGVRNVDKAVESLAQSSIAVRGAMVQRVEGVSSPVDLVHLDVVEDTVDLLASSLSGASALVIATGFVPSNPFKMDAAAHAVDNVGTIKLVDAAKKARVSKIVLVSSILTNGRAWGQQNSPGFQVTNAFGHVLDEKIVAERYLRASGIDYTIVRPGGLKAKAPTGALKVSAEDTLNSGEISRDLVAQVCVAALADSKASNLVVEIIEDDSKPATTSPAVSFV